MPAAEIVRAMMIVPCERERTGKRRHGGRLSVSSCSWVERRREEAGDHSPLLERAYVLLEHLGDAVGRVDAGADEKPVVVLLAGGWARNLAPRKRRRLMAAEERRLLTGRCVTRRGERG